MTDREPRVQWTQEHRQAVYWFEKGVAVVAFVVAAFAVPRYVGIAQYFFVGIGAVAVWKLFPSFRPVISGVVDRLPMLASKTAELADHGTEIEPRH